MIFFGCLGLETSTHKNKYFVLYIYREVSYMALKLRVRPSVSPSIPTGLNPYVDNLRYGVWLVYGVFQLFAAKLGYTL